MVTVWTSRTSLELRFPPRRCCLASTAESETLPAQNRSSFSVVSRDGACVRTKSVASK
ncbi:unnamed protein product [Ectocarpus sp. 8 AP-2014]